MREVLTPEGVTDRGDEFPTAEPGASGLAVLHREVAVRPRDVEVVISPDLVADLYDLILRHFHGYVGPHRRRHYLAGATTGHVPWYSRIMTVLLLTAMVVVPLHPDRGAVGPAGRGRFVHGPGRRPGGPRATARSTASNGTCSRHRASRSPGPWPPTREHSPAPAPPAEL